MAKVGIFEAAKTWSAAGCSIIPIRADGTKRPSIEWSSHMQVPASGEQIFNWFKHEKAGIGIVCGKVSGDLEMLELEGRATDSDSLDKIIEAVQTHGAFDTWIQLSQDGYAEWTPGGGIHFLYRIADHEVPGNTKIARRPASEDEILQEMHDTGLPREKVNKVKVLSETRGEGGFVVVAPSGGSVHPTGDSWSVCAGEIGVIPTITWAQREALVAAIHSALDEMPAAAPRVERPKLSDLVSGRLDRPGDEFNAKATWESILEPHGWTIHHHQGATTYWVRPGKNRKDGHSATTGHASDADRLYVFTSATEFEPETPYTKFAAYAVLEHHGDLAAAARTLRAMGYGATRTSPYVATPIQAPAVAPSGEPAADTQALATISEATQVANWHEDWAPPAVSDAKIVAAKPSYQGMAELFAAGYQNTFRYVSEAKQWRYFNGQAWTQDRVLAHEQACIQLLDRAHTAAQSHKDVEWQKWSVRASRASSPASLVNWARSHPKIRATVEDFDARRHMITMGNGTYNLDDHTFVDSFDPSLMLTRQLPVAFDPDADAPRWATFLEQVLPNGDVRSYVQRAAGLTLLGDAKERALFLLHGRSGTGKSQFVRVLELLFGDFAGTATSAAFNEQSKKASVTNDLNDLRGKRFVSLSELDQDERLNEALVKRMTGGDTAVSRALYQENQRWRVEFMLWMATNYLPRLNSDDNAIWRRVKPIEFPNVAEECGGEIKSIGEAIFAEEASGILNWLLDGVRAYQEQGLDDLPQITESVASYRRDVDTVAQFIDAALDEKMLAAEPQSLVPIRQLHTMYQHWCTSNGIKWLGERRFGQRMQSLGYERRKTEAHNVWVGLGVPAGNWMVGGGVATGWHPMRR